jgi:hypothetical protein
MTIKAMLAAESNDCTCWTSSLAHERPEVGMCDQFTLAFADGVKLWM